MSPMGRPIIGEKKDIDIKVRIGKEKNSKLIEYCEENNITRAEAIRKAIDILLKSN